MVMIGIIALLVLGMIAGAIAKYLFPGITPNGWLATILLGVLGSYVGGFIGSILGFGAFSKLSIPNIFLATIGAFIVLLIYNKIKK